MLSANCGSELQTTCRLDVELIRRNS